MLFRSEMAPTMAASVVRCAVFYVVLSVQLILQASAKIGGMVEHLNLEIQVQPTVPETPALGYLV